MLPCGREAQARASPDTVLSPLPGCFVRAVFLLLPVDTRLRCCEVSRAWRALLADTSLWARLNLSAGQIARVEEMLVRAAGQLRALDTTRRPFRDHLLVPFVSLPLFRAAVAKAGGQLRALDITGQQKGWKMKGCVRPLLEVVVTNAGALTELRVDTVGLHWFADEIRALLEVAPAKLQLLQVGLFLGEEDHQLARAMLRNEPPFQALRLRRLSIHRGLGSMAVVVAFCSDVRCHTSLEGLSIFGALGTAAAIGALVDACIALRLLKVYILDCHIVPATLPHLTRLIAAGALRELIVHNDDQAELFDEAHESTRLFVAAVGASAITQLRLYGMKVLPENVIEAAALINARPQ